jgi:hypothetical protein
MSTSYQKFEPSTSEEARVATAYTNLVEFLRNSVRDSGGRAPVLSTNRLLQVAGDIPLFRLADVLTQLVNDGWLEQFVRVENERGSTVQDFEGIEQVPVRVYDWKDSHEEFVVKPSNMRVYYRVHENSSNGR